MDGGYYKAFQKRLSRPIPPIFNKIFSQSEKQFELESLRKRSNPTNGARFPLAARGLHARATRLCQNRETRGFQPITKRASGGANAFGKDLAMMGIKNRCERSVNALRTLRHIDALEFLQD